MINIISATKFSEAEFWEKSALGLSLTRLRFDVRINPRITYENKLGLPSIYNAQIVAAGADDVLIFVHDDVWLDDYFIVDRVIEGLKTFDILGVVGSRRRLPYQPTWMQEGADLTVEDMTYWSGAIGSGLQPAGRIEYFGIVKEKCELMDGVFLAARYATLIKNSVYFDSCFDFHFYDLDFCRTARSRGLQLGTWPICLTHQSTATFESHAWERMHKVYFDKWGD